MNLKKLITAAKEIETRFKALKARTKFMRDLATEARNTGQSLAHRMHMAPQVVDFGDPVEDIVEALNQCSSKKFIIKKGFKYYTQFDCWNIYNKENMNKPICLCNDKKDAQMICRALNGEELPN